MRRYQPLVLQKLNIRVPGIHVRQLAVHRHLPETTALRPHAHKHAQCLLYLTGQGTQQIGGRWWEIRAGSAVFVPPRVEHAFRREANRRPICLVIDFDWRGARKKREQVAPLPMALLREARRQISFIARTQQPGDRQSLQVNTAILSLLDQLLRGLAMAGRAPAVLVSPVLRKIETLLTDPQSISLSLDELARRIGYQHDYLNRLLKNEAGLTLGQFRAQKILGRAEKVLTQSESIAEIADQLGFDNPNYFARWFRKQTGMTPSAWRKRQGA